MSPKSIVNNGIPYGVILKKFKFLHDLADFYSKTLRCKTGIGATNNFSNFIAWRSPNPDPIIADTSVWGVFLFAYGNIQPETPFITISKCFGLAMINRRTVCERCDLLRLLQIVVSNAIVHRKNICCHGAPPAMGIPHRGRTA